MKIIFIIGSLSDSHIIKRIEAFVKQNYEVEVYGYTRNVNFKNKINFIEPKVIGKLDNAKYLNRISKGFKEISEIIKQNPDNTLYYLWGFDVSMVHLFRGTNYIYEISDIRYADFKFGLNKLFKCIDKKIIENSRLTILTSEGFVDYIGIEGKILNKCILMPNKLATSMTVVARPQSDVKNDRIRIGYIGLYRYPNTVVRMARLIGEEYRYKFEFHFSGLANDPDLKAQIESLASHYDNIYEHGPFKNPDDLHKVYETIDVVACNYDIEGTNERVAEPNKLYESIYFNKALIVSENTFLAKKVSNLGCGFVINSQTDDSIRDFLNKLTFDDVVKKSQAASRIKTEDLIEDHTKLFQLIDKISI